MRIDSEVTLDEIVDAHLRQLKRSKMVQRLVWEWAIAVGILGSLLGIFALKRLHPDLSLFSMIVSVAIGIAVGVVLYFPVQRRGMARRVRRYLREQLGSDGPVPFQLEISETGVSWTQQGTEGRYRWAAIDAIEDSGDAIEFLARGGGFVVARRRAFASETEFQEFGQLARRLWERGRRVGDSGSGIE